MNIHTYTFYDTGGVIPGIVGQFSAGTAVDVDLDTMTVVETRSLNRPPFTLELALDGQPLATVVAPAPSDIPPALTEPPPSPSEGTPEPLPVEQPAPETVPLSEPEMQEPSSSPVDEQTIVQGE